MSEHSPYGFSSGASVLCPGKVPMEAKARAAGIGEGDTTDADRGTLRHQLVASSLPLEEVPEEHRWAVKQAREWFAQFARDGYPNWWELRLPIVVDGQEITYGTIDRVCGTEWPAPYFAGDQKHGEAMPHIEPLRWQMECAAVAVGQKFHCDTTEVGAYHIPSKTEWRETIGNLDALARDIKRRIDYAKAHPDELKPSPAACQFCLGKAICPAFQEKTYELVRLEEDNRVVRLAGGSTELTLPWLKKVLEWKPLASKLFDTVTEQAKKLSEEELASIGFRRREIQMPVMKSTKTDEKYIQVRIERIGK